MKSLLYQCRHCGDWWLQRDPAVSCLVNHGDDVCCHFGERKVDRPGE